jgi:hypothetical protein
VPTLTARAATSLAAITAALAFGLSWAWARYENTERLRLARVALSEQGPSRGGAPPEEDEVRERSVALARERGVTLRDLTVQVEDVDGLAGPLAAALSASEAGASLSGALRVRSRVYSLRATGASRTLVFTLEEPVEARFSVRLSVTMAPGFERPVEPPREAGERSVGRGL